MSFLDRLARPLPPPTRVGGSGDSSDRQREPGAHHSSAQNQQRSRAGLNGTSGAPRDERPLPPGWEKQWHDGYQRYFYVNTQAPGGPRSQWEHPADQQPVPDQRPYYAQPAVPAFNPPPYFSGQPYQQPIHPSQPVANNGRGRRAGGINPLAAGAGGLAGGMLLGSLLGGHHHDSYFDGYERGYFDGFGNGPDDFGYSGDFGGVGDFGGMGDCGGMGGF